MIMLWEFSPDPKISRTSFLLIITLRALAIGKLGAENRNPYQGHHSQRRTNPDLRKHAGCLVSPLDGPPNLH